MTVTGTERIAARTRELLLERVRAAVVHEVSAQGGEAHFAPELVDQLVREAAQAADPAVWRMALAEATADELGLTAGLALERPELREAAELVGAPSEALPAAPAPEPTEPAAPTHDAADAPDAQTHEHEHETAAASTNGSAGATPETGTDAVAAQALRIAATHSNGIESLKPGEKDLELRLSDAGLDVIKRSSGMAIGRLAWSEVVAIELTRPRRGLGSRRKSHQLEVRTERGQAQFELPSLTDDEVSEHLEPMLDHVRTLGASAPAGS